MPPRQRRQPSRVEVAAEHVEPSDPNKRMSDASALLQECAELEQQLKAIPEPIRTDLNTARQAVDALQHSSWRSSNRPLVDFCTKLALEAALRARDGLRKLAVASSLENVE